MILRDQSQIAAASLDDLRETLKALTGVGVAAFTSAAAARARVANAMLAAQDAAGHLGVPKGAAPAVMTLDEREARRYPVIWPEPRKSEPKAAPAAAAPVKKSPSVGRPSTLKHSRIIATFAGDTKPREQSARGVCLSIIQAAGAVGLMMADIERQLDENETHRGQNVIELVNKLRAKNHVTVVAPQEPRQ